MISTIRQVTQGRGFLLQMVSSDPTPVLRQALSRGPRNEAVISAVEQALAEVNN